MGSSWGGAGDTKGELFPVELGSLMAHSSGPTHSHGMGYIKTQHTASLGSPPSSLEPLLRHGRRTLQCSSPADKAVHSSLIRLQQNLGFL